MPATAVDFPLLDGEANSGALDASHWLGVYDELIEFCRSILAEDDVFDGLNRDRVTRRIRHFESRRRHWRRVLDSANPVDAQGRQPRTM